jgi:uncharacterized protein YecT (DUF1311 family)
MRRLRAFAAATVAAVLCLATTARAQQPDEVDPCADVAGRIDTSACWAREAERAESELHEALDALLAKLPSRAAEALRKDQKLWLESRDAHLALLFAIANPENRHRWEDAICAAIAKRELTRARTRVLKRLGEPGRDEACPL